MGYNGGGMKKLKTMPRLTKEIIITVISFVVLYILWYFFIGEFIVISDQGLSTIGIALITSIGVLTAIVVSFVLIVWQTSRRDRSESFLRWRNTLRQFIEFYNANANPEKLKEVQNEVNTLIYEASQVAFFAPMNLGRCGELISAISNKITKYLEQSQRIKNPSAEQVEKVRVNAYMNDYLVTLTHVNFDHNVAHNLYDGVLGLRGLLYRLLSVLIACIVVVTIAATTASVKISDIFNTSLALILVAWAIYVLIHLGIEIKRLTRLEDEFRRLESEMEDEPQRQEKK
jgi:hypothetical protein